jgi:hypothetical protein
MDQRAEESLYRWWWEFLKASRDFPEFREELANKTEVGARNADGPR